MQSNSLESRRSILLLGIASFLLDACGTEPNLRVQASASGIQVAFVEFPVWRRDASQPLSLANEFSGRIAGVGSSMELLVRGGSESAMSSIDCYAIKLQPPFSVRSSTLSEWESAAAETLPRKQYIALRREDEIVLSFQGRKYQRQGQFWRQAATSPGGRWLVLYSHDDGDWTRIGRGSGPFARGTPSKGASYFEVFDTTDGLRVFIAKTRWSDQLTLGALEWLGDRYLLLTVDARSPFHQKCLLVVFPQ